MKQPRTICICCKWCLYKPEDKNNPNRFDYRCGAVIHDAALDPVTGADIFLTHEAKFQTEEMHPNCVDMNRTGDCAVYEEKV